MGNWLLKGGWDHVHRLQLGAVQRPRGGPLWFLMHSEGRTPVHVVCLGSVSVDGRRHFTWPHGTAGMFCTTAFYCTGGIRNWQQLWMFLTCSIVCAFKIVLGLLRWPDQSSALLFKVSGWVFSVDWVAGIVEPWCSLHVVKLKWMRRAGW